MDYKAVRFNADMTLITGDFGNQYQNVTCTLGYLLSNTGSNLLRRYSFQGTPDPTTKYTDLNTSSSSHLSDSLFWLNPPHRGTLEDLKIYEYEAGIGAYPSNADDITVRWVLNNNTTATTEANGGKPNSDFTNPDFPLVLNSVNNITAFTTSPVLDTKGVVEKGTSFDVVFTRLFQGTTTTYTGYVYIQGYNNGYMYGNAVESGIDYVLDDYSVTLAPYDMDGWLDNPVVYRYPVSNPIVSNQVNINSYSTEEWTCEGDKSFITYNYDATLLDETSTITITYELEKSEIGEFEIISTSATPGYTRFQYTNPYLYLDLEGGGEYPITLESVNLDSPVTLEATLIIEPAGY
jgi:hypothetical protein